MKFARPLVVFPRRGGLYHEVTGGGGKWDEMIMYSRDSQILQKSMSHLKILDARRVIWSKFFTDSPQILGPTVQNVLSRATWRPVLYIPFYRKLTGTNFDGETTGKGRTYTAFSDVVSRKHIETDEEKEVARMELHFVQNKRRNCPNTRTLSVITPRDYPLSYRVPVRERYGSTLLPATREQHDQNCTQSH